MSDSDIPICHRTVIALQHDRALRLFIAVGPGSGGACNFHVFVDYLAVVDHLHELTVRGLLAVRTKSGGSKYNFERLPFSRRLAGVDARRVTFEALFAFAALRIPALINASGIAMLEVLLAIAVQHLNLIAAHKVDAGVRAFRHHEFNMRFDVPMLDFAEQISSTSLRAVVDDILAILNGELSFVLRIFERFADFGPISRRPPMRYATVCNELNPRVFAVGGARNEKDE